MSDDDFDIDIMGDEVNDKDNGLDIFDSIKGKEKKVPVSVTIDEPVYKEVLALKTKLKIETLSPIINEMLKDWISKNKNKKKTK